MLTLLRPAASLLSSKGQRARLSILIYHRVLETADPLLKGVVDAAQFSWQMRLLAEHFNVLPLEQAVLRLRQGTLPARAVCITFDDGYADNASIALPILKSYSLNATFFIATGFLDGGRMWNDTVIEAVRGLTEGSVDLSAIGLTKYSIHSDVDRLDLIKRILQLRFQAPEDRQKITDYLSSLVSKLPDNLMMTSEQVQKLHRSGMGIGGHTVNHPILTHLDDAIAQQEIATNKEQLESLINAPVTLFAYPNGRPGEDYDNKHADIVRELGFSAAVSTAWGVANNSSNFWQLPRFTPWDRTPARFMARLMLNYRQLKVA